MHDALGMHIGDGVQKPLDKGACVRLCENVALQDAIEEFTAGTELHHNVDAAVGLKHVLVICSAHTCQQTTLDTQR